MIKTYLKHKLIEYAIDTACHKLLSNFMTVDLGVLPIGKIFKYLSYVDRHNSRMVILRGKIVPIEQYYNNNLDYTVRVSGSMTTIYLNTKHQLEKTERIDDWPVYVCNNELVVR